MFDKNSTNNDQKSRENSVVPIECPPRENKTVVEPIEDIRDKIEF